MTMNMNLRIHELYEYESGTSINSMNMNTRRPWILWIWIRKDHEPMNMNLKACNLSIHIIHTAHELGSYDYDSYEFEAVLCLAWFNWFALTQTLHKFWDPKIIIYFFLHMKQLAADRSPPPEPAPPIRTGSSIIFVKSYVFLQKYKEIRSVNHLFTLLNYCYQVTIRLICYMLNIR